MAISLAGAIPADQREQFPLLRPKLYLPYPKLQAIAMHNRINVRRAQCGKSARWVLWEPEVGDYLRPPGEVLDERAYRTGNALLEPWCKS